MIAALAPVLPSAIQALSRRGLDLLSGVLNGAADKGVDQVAGMIETRLGIRVEDIAEEKLTEEQWVALKEFELNQQEVLVQQMEVVGGAEVDRVRLANEDRSDARRAERDRAARPDWLARNFLYLFAFGLTGLTFGFIAWAAFFMVPDTGDNGALTEGGRAQLRVVDTVLGFMLGTTLAAIVQFFFGSSAGSSKKGDAIERFLDDSRIRKEPEAGR